jgi:hypothetical protein
MKVPKVFDTSFCEEELREHRRTRGDDNETQVKLVAPAVLVASFAASAFAADEFLVVQDAKTNKCTSR